MAVYNIKDSLSTRKYSKGRANTGKMKKCRWLHLNCGIRVSYNRRAIKVYFFPLLPF